MEQIGNMLPGSIYLLILWLCLGHAEEHIPSITYTLADSGDAKPKPGSQPRKTETKNNEAAQKNNFFSTLDWQEKNDSLGKSQPSNKKESVPAPNKGIIKFEKTSIRLCPFSCPYFFHNIFTTQILLTGRVSLFQDL